MRKTEKQTLIQMLTNFFEGKEITGLGRGTNAIRFDPIFKKLKRVWNNGNGLIDFGQISDGTLLINKLFCSKKEIQDIENNLKVKFTFVELGYPSYYFHDLETMWKLNK